jgi:hypothetical protein
MWGDLTSEPGGIVLARAVPVASRRQQGSMTHLEMAAASEHELHIHIALSAVIVIGRS